MKETQGSTLFNAVCCFTRYQQFRYFTAKSLDHLCVANVGNALQCQVDMHWIAIGQVVLDVLDDQTHEVTVGTNQH